MVRKKSVKKIGITPERQERTEQIFNLMRQGKSNKAIAKKFKVSEQTVSSDVTILRKRFGGNIIFLPRTGKKRLSARKIKKYNKFIDFAKTIIESQETIKPKKKANIQFEKKRWLSRKALEKNPYRTNTEIAAETNISSQSVQKMRKRLIENGTIPSISISTRISISAKRRIRGENAKSVLSLKRRLEILKEHNSFFQAKANNLYNSNKDAFDFFKITPKDLAKKLKANFSSRLEVFDPKKMKGEEKMKLRHFVDRETSYAARSIRLSTQKRYEAYKASGKKPVEKKQPLPVKEKTLPPSELIAFTEAKSKQLKLNLTEKAVLFGFIAKLSGAEIGRRLGCGRENVRQIKENLKKLMGEL